MANTDQQQIIVLRDGSGNYFVISGEAIEASRVPEEKKAALEEALQGGDVSGFFLPPGFNNVAFQNIIANIPVTNVNQTNTANANNILIGGVVVGSPQTIAQIQSNSFAGLR